MSFRLVPKSVTLVTLNGIMAVILRYFSEFVYLPGVLRKSSRSLSRLLMSSCYLLWPPYVIGQAIIFLPCGFYLLMVALWNRADHNIFVMSFVLLLSSFFFSTPNLSRRRLDVCHTSTHDLALVRI